MALLNTKLNNDSQKEPAIENVTAGATSSGYANTINQGEQYVQSAQRPNTGTSQPKLSSLASFVSGFNSHISVPYDNMNHNAAAYLKGFEEAASQVEGLRGNPNWRLLTFTVPASLISSILYLRTDATRVTVFTFLLENTLAGGQLQNVRYTRQNGQYNETFELPRATEEIWTAERTYSTEVQNFVKSLYPNHEIVLASALTIHREVKPDDSHALRRCLYYANIATQSVITALEGNVVTINLAESQPEERLGVRVKFDNNYQVATATRLPVRASVTTELTLSTGNRQNNQNAIFQNQAPSVLGNVFGFMSFYFIGNNNRPVVNTPYGYPQPQPQWQPVFVINAVDQPTTVQTLGQTLLTLSTASSIVVNDIWKQAWAPRNTIVSDSVGDVNNIGLLTALASSNNRELLPTDIRDPQFNYPAFMAEHMANDVLIQIQVPELGDTNFLQRTLIEASGAAGDERMTTANQLILNAANYLTNGNFEQIWTQQTNGNPHEPFFANQVGRVELGYYNDKNGEIRDLSFIDPLWLMSLTNDAALANLYIDSFDPSRGDSQLRQKDRMGIYDNLLNGAYTITGYALRLSVNPKFLYALDAAIRTLKPVTLEQGQFFNADRVRGFNSVFGGMNSAYVSPFYMNQNAGAQSQGYSAGYYAMGATPYMGAFSR